MHTRKLIRVFQPPRVLQGRKGSICTAVLHTFMQVFFVSLFSFQCTGVYTFWTDGTFCFHHLLKCLVLPLRTHSFVKFFVIRFTPLTFFMLPYCVLVVNTFLFFFFRCHKSWFVVPCPADRYYITTSCSQCQHIFLKKLKKFFLSLYSKICNQ